MEEHGEFTVPVDLMHVGHHFEGDSNRIIQRYELNVPVKAQANTLIHVSLLLDIGKN